MRLKPEETDLLCKLTFANGRIVGDETCERIDFLTTQYLEKVAGGGWDTLYRDPEDARYWELTYPESHMHGGGPPRLTYLSHEQVREKYGDEFR